jgi:imidazole glycerol phosphate synthase glutamine amidotransferase subunit
MTQVALIDYGSGNLHSAERALREAAALAGTSHEIIVTDSPETILEATRIVLPGVGHFADCAAGLRAREGVVDALNEAVLKEGKPFFGICVGMQLMATAGLEDGYTAGLGWIKGTVDIIEPGEGFRIPHMGWNGLTFTRLTPHPVLADPGRGSARLFHPFLCDEAGQPGRRGRNGGLWRPHRRGGRPAQHVRHAVPSGEEPDNRAQDPLQFPAMGALTPK